LENARAITLTGQYIIKSVEYGVNNDLNNLFGIKDTWGIYMDTDSIYLSLKSMVYKFYKDVSQDKLVDIIAKICKDKISPIINKHCIELQDYTNNYRKSIVFKIEVIAKNGVFCCHPNTNVIIDGICINIQDLYDKSIGGIVDSVILSFDKISNVFELDIVEEVLRREYSGDMYEFYLENGEILKVTENHIIYVNRNGVIKEVAAKDVLESDEFITI
jgi:hypothetical protein